MGFPRRLLADHERVVFELRPHWVAAVPPVLWTAALLVGLLLGYRAVEAAFGDAFLPQAVVGAAFTALWVWLALVPLLRWRTTLFVLTTDRLISRSGVLARRSREIPLERINDVTCTQTVAERLIGAGDLVVESGGERGQTLISNVRKPEEVQLLIYKQVEANRGAPPRLGLTIPQQIEALARLRDLGAITPEEYEAKKEELLGRM